MMTDEVFLENFKDFYALAMKISETARREGLLALEDTINQDLVLKMSVWDLGLQMIVDGSDWETIGEIVDNLINQSSDLNERLLLRIKKKALIEIQKGTNPRLISLHLLSFVNSEAVGIKPF